MGLIGGTGGGGKPPVVRRCFLAGQPSPSISIVELCTSGGCVMLYGRMCPLRGRLSLEQ